jgi:hypothetical protein
MSIEEAFDAVAQGINGFVDAGQQAARAAALIDRVGATVKPGQEAIFDIDDTCTADGGQQLAFWNAHTTSAALRP